PPTISSVPKRTHSPSPPAGSYPLVTDAFRRTSWGSVNILSTPRIPPWVRQPTECTGACQREMFAPEIFAREMVCTVRTGVEYSPTSATDSDGNERRDTRRSGRRGERRRRVDANNG